MMKLTRRQFNASAASVLGIATSIAAPPVSAADFNAMPLRVIAYNIFKCTGWPHQRRLAKQAVAQGQMAKRLAMELALYSPDIINFSESPSEQLTLEIAQELGMYHVRFPSGGSWPGTLLSRFKIVESHNAPMLTERPAELFTRHWGRAVVELASGDSLVIHSAHLYPTADPAIRLREIRAMIDSMRMDMESGRSMLLMGDLNHGPDTDEYKLWMDAGWVDTFAKVGKGSGATIKSDLPKWRIDYVMAAGPISDRVTESRPLFEGAFRLNIYDSESFALSDHLPQYASFE